MAETLETRVAALDTQTASLDSRLAKLERELARVSDKNSQTHKVFFDRLEKIETQNSANAEKYRNIELQLDAINKKLDQIAQKPIKRLEAALEAAITFAVGALLGAFFHRFGG